MKAARIKRKRVAKLQKLSAQKEKSSTIVANLEHALTLMQKSMTANKERQESTPNTSYRPTLP